MSPGRELCKLKIIGSAPEVVKNVWGDENGDQPCLLRARTCNSPFFVFSCIFFHQLRPSNLSLNKLNLQLVGRVAVEWGEGVGVVGRRDGEGKGDGSGWRCHNWNSPFCLLPISRHLRVVSMYRHSHLWGHCCKFMVSPDPTCSCKPTHTQGLGWCCGSSTRRCRKSARERRRERLLLGSEDSLKRDFLMMTTKMVMMIIVATVECEECVDNQDDWDNKDEDSYYCNNYYFQKRCWTKVVQPVLW